MKITELNSIETEVLDHLRARAKNGDNEAADVILNHLRESSINIEHWKARKDARRELLKNKEETK